MDYLSWNDILTEHFLGKERSGAPLYLYANEDLVNRLGEPHASEVADLVRAAKLGPPWVTQDAGFCQKAFEAMDGWRNRELRFPPYIAYLVVFVLAASLKTEFSAIAYYKPLRKLLGEPTESNLAFPGFNRMQELWKDLEVWTSSDTNGQFGVFAINWAALSKWKHVGLPISQALLTDSELAGLKRIYAESALDPTATPSDMELKDVLARYGTGLLRPRTLKILREAAFDDRTHVLVSIVRQDLRAWNGEVGSEANEIKSAYAAIRVGCHIDRVERTIRFYFRCKSPSEFPEDELHAVLPDGRTALCEEEQEGWSTSFVNSLDGNRIDAADFDWTQGFSTGDKKLSWRMVFTGGLVKIFAQAMQFGGFVEISKIPSEGHFFVAAHTSVSDVVTEWGKNDCTDFQDLSKMTGLPLNWTFFQISGVRSDERIRKELPRLSLSRSLDIGTVGGIRVARGNQFFYFAPPLFEVGGAPDYVRANSLGRALNLVIDEATGLFLLKDELPIDQPIEIEAGKAEESARVTISLVTTDKRRGELKSAWFDGYGRKAAPSYDAKALVSGARCINVSPLEFEFGLETQFAQSSGFLVGRVPGEIVFVPKQRPPIEWEPVWFIRNEPPREVHFCGTDIANSNVGVAPAAVTAEHVVLWKKILWTERDLLRTPEYPKLQCLWAEYQAVAARL